MVQTVWVAYSNAFLASMPATSMIDIRKTVLSTSGPKSPIDEFREFERFQPESIGWIPLEPGAYRHISYPDATEILIAGVPQAGAAVLLLG